MLVNFAGNIAAFIPMGILLGLLSRRLRKVKYIALLCLTVSIVIELLQYIFALRVTDIDDVILNVLGGIIGYTFLNIVKFTRSE